MLKKKFILMAILVSLLAISAVNASEDVSNSTIASDIDDSVLELNAISDSTIESADNEINFDGNEENNTLQSTDDDIYSFVDDDAWFNDKIIWYGFDATASPQEGSLLFQRLVCFVRLQWKAS